MTEELSLRDVRLQKLEQLRELGLDPYAVERFDSTGSAGDLLQLFPSEGDFAESEAPDVAFAGRIVSYRLMGKAGFAHLSDGDGKIQAYFRKDDLSEEAWEAYTLLDIGDHVGVHGFLFRTRTGERSIHVRELKPLSKCLHALPIGKEKDGQQWYALEDVEARYRHRHLDLIANKPVRDTLIARSKIVSAVRRYFESHDYLEVETPMLQVIAGGAAARPFVTHYNAYDMAVKLRISLELYLKRLICGDLPKVFEIGKVFRNEGVSNRHNPEFTLLEWYEAYANLEDMMGHVEGLFRFVARQVFGTEVVHQGQPYCVPRASNRKLSFRKVWRRIGLIRSVTLHGVTIRGNQPLDIKERFVNQYETITTQFPTAITFEGPGVAHVYDTESGPLIGLQQGGYFKVEEDSISTWVEPGWWFPVTCTSGLTWGDVDVDRNRFVDYSRPWLRVDLLTEIERHTGLTAADLSSLDKAKAALGDRKVVNPQNGKRIIADEEHHLGGLIEKLLEVFVEPTLIEPTFVVGYPIETSPLAKKDPRNPRMTRRFEAYIGGREVANAFSEINDPIDQRERFEMQQRQAERGDEESHPMDEEYIYALECGMPPTGGCGIGIDRLVMTLTGADSIREAVLFPMMKPESRNGGED